MAIIVAETNWLSNLLQELYVPQDGVPIFFATMLALHISMPILFSIAG